MPTTRVYAICLLLFIAVTSRDSIADDSEFTASIEQPNIVFLVADDLGYGETGCQGNPEIPTPHIDSIAQHGVRFTNGYVTAAFCSASRAGMLTGRYQTRFGHEFNPIGARNEDPLVGLPLSQTTLADRLHDVGYATALIGKWHLGGTASYHPHRRGFDEFFGFLHEGHYFVPPPYPGVWTMLRRKALPGNRKGRWTSRDGRLTLSTHMGHDEPDYDADNPVYRGGQPVVERSYLTDAFTREAVDFIRRTSERPFFLLLAYNAVHSPLQAPDAYMQRFAHIEDVHRRIFAAMLSSMDDSVGAVLQELKRQKLQRRTLVVFLSDNGGPTRELTSSNLPLRGEKGSLLEGGIRVPFLMSWPGVLEEGRVYDHPVISMDLFATATSVAGADAGQTDGVSLIPFLTGAATGRPHETLFWRAGRKAALRHADWKIVRNPGRGQSSDWQLYDLSSDIGEQHDAAMIRKDVLGDLIQRWEQLNAQMIAPVF